MTSLNSKRVLKPAQKCDYSSTFKPMAGSDLAVRICPVWHMRDAPVSRYDPATASYRSMPPYLRYLAKI